jgi:hypothetical protein
LPLLPAVAVVVSVVATGMIGHRHLHVLTASFLVVLLHRAVVFVVVAIFGIVVVVTFARSGTGITVTRVRIDPSSLP